MGGIQSDKLDRMKASADTQLRLRVGGNAIRLAVAINAAIAVVFLFMLLFGLILINGERHPGLSIVGGIGLLMPIYLLFHGANSGVVTADSIMIKSARWSNPKSVPLVDVVAVGMIYTIQPRISGWRCYVWRKTGEAVPLPIGLLIGPKPDAPHAAEQVRSSQQGQISSQVFHRVMAFQGNSGPVVSDREVQRRGTLKKERAYWSANPQVQGIHILPKNRE
jgi:hypothetical protein